MKLTDLPGLLDCEPRPCRPIEVASVTEDSRRVRPGSVFVAVPGERADGHDFVQAAIDAGAVGIVGPRDVQLWQGVPYFRVGEPRAAAGVLAQAAYGFPSRAMVVIGITGTNGKSSTAWLVQRIIEASGHRAACFGTLGYDTALEKHTAPLTTPSGEDLARLMAEARDAGVSHLVMEVSSHSLEQGRVAGIEFAVGAFTNLTQDHLDYHASMDEYLAAKLRLFKRVQGHGRFTVINREDPSADAFIAASNQDYYTYGAGGDCRAVHVEMDATRTRFDAETPWGNEAIELKLLGKHNLSNALCALTICGGLNLSLPVIAKGIASVDAVPGRFERIDEGQPFAVIVDYAHTEDGLVNVLRASREICRGRLIVVFGCGGDRDTGKRPKMGAAAGELADFSIITSDNPRTEDPHRILLDIEVGMQRAGRRKYDEYLMIEDRAEAIREGIKRAGPGDCVLIAGKGHEDYQILGTGRIHFDDREVARAALAET